MQTAIIIAIASAGISCTLSKSKVFEIHRTMIMRRTAWGGWLVNCPYCLVHWVASAGCAAYQPRLVHSNSVILDLVTTTFAVICVGCFLAGWMVRVWWWYAE